MSHTPICTVCRPKKPRTERVPALEAIGRVARSASGTNRTIYGLRRHFTSKGFVAVDGTDCALQKVADDGTVEVMVEGTERVPAIEAIGRRCEPDGRTIYAIRRGAWPSRLAAVDGSDGFIAAVGVDGTVEVLVEP